MKVLVIAGFTGAGKTSLLLRIARVLTERSLNVAIIENEVGEIGIDGKYLREGGLEVQELYGGCICCTLATNLVLTLREIEERYRVDWTLIEPTGLATPAQVVEAITSGLPGIEQVSNICLVDAPRFIMMSTVMAPLLTAQIHSADIVAVNKADLVSEQVIKDVVDGVREINPSVSVVVMSAENGENVDLVVEGIR